MLWKISPNEKKTVFSVGRLLDRGFEQEMNVIRHDAGRVERVALFIPVKQRFQNNVAGRFRRGPAFFGSRR